MYSGCVKLSIVEACGEKNTSKTVNRKLKVLSNIQQRDFSVMSYCHTRVSNYGAHPVTTIVSKVSVMRSLTSIKNAP